MSEVNISRFVETALKERTTPYSPLIEAIVNSIEAIWETNRLDGVIILTPVRDSQIPLEGNALPDIVGFVVEDNGIGFNKKNRDAFDTLCTDYKIKMGGKGLGRFIFLKYFKKVKFSSVYRNNGKYHIREFKLGYKNVIIENEKDLETDAADTKTKLSLEGLKQHSFDKELNTIARKILERILVFFISDSFKCPTIILRENGESIILNNLIGVNQEIQHVHSAKFTLTSGTSEVKEDLHDFQVEIYKIVYPGTVTSKICLAAHSRQVTEMSLYKYIPEFKDNFYEIDGQKTKNYIIRAYVLGGYLNENVSLERGGFNFPTEESDTLLYPFSQQAIEKEAARIVENLFKDQVKVRRDKKYETIKKYVNESAPWNKTYLKDLDLSTLPYDLDEQTMESALQKIRFRKEKEGSAELKKIVNDPKLELFAKVNESVKLVQQAGISDLTHYVVLRKIVLDMLKALLEIKDDGKYSKEAEIHNLFFPMKSNSEITDYADHNLWILDEKLNFTELVTSDKATDKEGKNRPDLLIFNKKMAYRSGNERSNPVTIFEFKQPQRGDFVNQSTKEDPIEQIIRYTIDLKEGKYTTPEGRDMYVDENTPFYGYLICDFTSKIKDWLYKIKDFTPMPDGQGYYQWVDSNRLYIEVLSWDKILKDAEQRNKIFFKKLGIA